MRNRGFLLLIFLISILSGCLEFNPKSDGFFGENKMDGVSQNPSCKNCNLILITLDTVRADHLGVYGYFRNTTPNINYLASKSIIFTRHYSPIPETLPSHASLFTGKYPYEHKLQRNKHILYGNHTTLTEILRHSGYNTAAITSARHLVKKTGFGQGFDFFNSSKEKERPARPTTNIALNWLKNQDEKFFLWIHYFDAHKPYKPPKAYDTFTLNSNNNTEKIIGRYDGEIKYIDSQLGLLIKYLEKNNKLEKTVVIITSDHGESLGLC